MRSVYDVNDTTNMQRVFALFYLGKSWNKLIQCRAKGGKEGASAARSGKPQKLYVEELCLLSLYSSVLPKAIRSDASASCMLPLVADSDQKIHHNSYLLVAKCASA